MRATSAFVRLFIRGISWDAVAEPATFADTLRGVAQAQVKDTSRGKVLIRARANGTEAFYSLPPSDGLTAKDISEVVSFVLDKVDELIAATPSLADNDSALVAALLAAFPTIRSHAVDFSSPMIR